MKVLLLSSLILWFSIPIFSQTFGNAIDLDGIDDYAIVPHHESLNPVDDSWSVAFWLQAADIDQVAPVVMKRLPEPPYTQYSYAFGKDDPHYPEPGKRIRVNHIENAGVSERSGHTTVEVIDGNWHHIVIVADKEQDGIMIFVDGSPLEFVPLYYFGLWPNVETTYDLIIASGSSGSKIKGPMDELSFWNKALDQFQIQQIMYDTLSPEYYTSADSGLVAYFRFEEYENLGIGNGDFDDICDLSYYNNHADSEGSPSLIPSGVLINIENNFVSSDILIYPNPARNQFEVRGLKHAIGFNRIELFDLSGKSMMVLFDEDSASDLFKFDVSKLPSGIYFCRFTIKNRSLSKKLIIN